MVKRIGLIVITISLWSFLHVLGNSYALKQCSTPQILSILNDSLSVDESFEVDYLPLFNTVFLNLEDLQSCNIDIWDKKIKTTMVARPNFFSLFCARSKRKYETFCYWRYSW